MKRIAMISMHTCPLAALGGKETGGMNVYIRDLSRELSRRGHYIYVFTRQQKTNVEKVTHGLGQNARVIHIPAGPVQPLNKNTVFNYVDDFTDGVLSFAAGENLTYDIIHSHYWLSGWASGKLREVWQIPVIQMFHTLGHMKNSVAQSEDEKESQKRIDVEAEIMRFADRLIAATPMERAQMAWLYGANPGKVSVVPCGVDTTLFSPKPAAEARAFLELPQDQPLILFVGRIEPLKGIDTLIRAIDIILTRFEWPNNPPALLIVGGALEDSLTTHVEEVMRLRELTESLGLANQITFLGSKPQDLLAYYYSAADVVVVPSHYESFGMVALEAMACGTPVIASKVGGLSLAVQDGVTGYLVPNGDPEHLADILKLVLSQPQLAQVISQQAIRWAQRFRWPLIAQRILEVYDETICQMISGKKETKACQCES